MTMIKNTMMALGVSAIALTAMQGAAEAGGKKHKRHFNHHWGHHDVYHGNYYKHSYRGCWRFKRKYHRTGKKYWLKRYYICRYDRY